MDVAEATRNAFSKQVSTKYATVIVEITERLFKKAVPIHFVSSLYVLAMLTRGPDDALVSLS